MRPRVNYSERPNDCLPSYCHCLSSMYTNWNNLLTIGCIRTIFSLHRILTFFFNLCSEGKFLQLLVICYCNSFIVQFLDKLFFPLPYSLFTSFYL